MVYIIISVIISIIFIYLFTQRGRLLEAQTKMFDEYLATDLLKSSPKEVAERYYKAFWSINDVYARNSFGKLWCKKHGLAPSTFNKNDKAFVSAITRILASMKAERVELKAQEAADYDGI